MTRSCFFHLPLLLTLLLVPFHATEGKPTSRPAPAKTTAPEPSLSSWASTMSEAVSLANHLYYAPLDAQEAMKRSLSAFAHLDPHCSFLDADSFAEIRQRTKGEFCGAGLVLPGHKEIDDEFVPIIDTVPMGPADMAGIKTGDKIIQVDGQVVHGLSLDDVITKIKGPRHSTLALTVLRNTYPEPIIYQMERDILKEDDVLVMYLPETNVWYLALTMFTEQSYAHIKNVLERAHQKKSRGIVLDLRNNSGGLLDAAVDIASLFIPRASLVVETRNKQRTATETYRTEHDPSPYRGIPLVLLVNNHTASSAEILAGTLKTYAIKLQKQPAAERPNIIIVGTQTFGKGSVQDVVPLSNACALKLTTGLYYLADGSTVQGIGITPDIIIEAKFPPPHEITWINRLYGRETALPGHLSAEGKVTPKPKQVTEPPKKPEQRDWKEERRRKVASDSQIQSAFNILEMLALAQKAASTSFTRDQALSFLKKHYATEQELKLELVTL